jgi:hypothetical protein
MGGMFINATSFTAAGLNNWTPTSCIDMSNMFNGTSAAYTSTQSTGLFITDLSDWPNTAISTLFFSPDGITDTTTTDPKSPFFV